MDFRIAVTFTEALARLTTQEQKAAKTTAFDLQMNPTAPGLSFHRIDRSKDPNFWSLRVSRDVRIIVHRTAASLLLAYVDHHDRAYAWAERRRIEAHPRTGAVQIVEVRERVEEVTWAPPAGAVMADAEAGALARLATLPIFAALEPDDLLAVGVPPDWLEDVRQADEDRFLALVDHLPTEAAEALLEYAGTGALPVGKPRLEPATAEAFAHPDAQRRFRTVENLDELRAALDYPWERWTVFLHPSQRSMVEQAFSGPARIAGSAGTGKTVVALHRAVRLARADPRARLLLTTFSETLATALARKLRLLVDQGSGIPQRITVASFRGMALELFEMAQGYRPRIASEEQIRSVLAEAAQGASGFGVRFLISEWMHVVDAWQIGSAEAYAEVPRLGRKNRIGAKQRARLWSIFAASRESLNKRGLCTWPQVFRTVAGHYAGRPEKPFTHIVVDEAQDLGVPDLRFLKAIVPDRPDALFFAGDLGQRIFQQPFSWKSLGIDVRGRSFTLKVNYRTSHQIREAADRLLPPRVRDVDGREEERRGTISVFNGPRPRVALYGDEEAEIAAVAGFVRDALAAGTGPAEIGVFVRTEDELPRARAAAAAAGQLALELSDQSDGTSGRIAIGLMHLAKGLEFKAVAVMACDDEVLPLQSRVEAVADEVELDDAYETERQLLYVACTRARDRLLVAGVAPGSEFLKDLEEQAS